MRPALWGREETEEDVLPLVEVPGHRRGNARAEHGDAGDVLEPVRWTASFEGLHHIVHRTIAFDLTEGDLVPARGRLELKRLRFRFRRSTPFDAIYSSPLRRAAETAMVLTQAGLGPLHTFPALQEIDCGCLDGMSLDYVQRSYPELWQANQRQADGEFRWPGGESYREFRSRCLAAVRRLAQKHPCGRIAVVTHGGVISQIVGYLVGTSPAEWERNRVGNTAVTEIDWERSGGRIVRFDDQAHLRLRHQADSAGFSLAPDSVGSAEHPQPFPGGVRCA